MTRSMTVMFCICAILLFASRATGESPLIFKGLVVDGAERPVAGAEVLVFDSADVKRPADYISEKTGADGLFLLQLRPGRYWTMAVQRTSGAKIGPLAPTDRYSGSPLVFEGKAGQEVNSDFTVMELKEAALLNRKRNDELIRVTGRILNVRGQPVAGAYVLAGPAPRGDWPAYLSAWTEADGRYTIFLPKGKIFIGTSRIFSSGNGYHLAKEVDFVNDAVGVDLIIGDATPAEGGKK